METRPGLPQPGFSLLAGATVSGGVLIWDLESPERGKEKKRPKAVASCKARIELRVGRCNNSFKPDQTNYSILWRC